MNQAQLNFVQSSNPSDAVNLSNDGRHFLNWYSSTDIFRIAYAMFKHYKTESQELIHKPIMVYEASFINFEKKMAYCRSLLQCSNKKILPFVIAPELSACHFMAGLIRRNDNGSFDLFLFNPTGYSKEQAKKRLDLSCIDYVSEMKMIISAQKIQTIEKDEQEPAVDQPALVSCGPISLMFIKHILAHGEYALALNDTFELPSSIFALGNLEKQAYQEQIVAERQSHYDLLATINDDDLTAIDNINYHYINGLLEFMPDDETESESIYSYDEDIDATYQDLDEEAESKRAALVLNYQDLGGEAESKRAALVHNYQDLDEEAESKRAALVLNYQDLGGEAESKRAALVHNCQDLGGEAESKRAALVHNCQDLDEEAESKSAALLQTYQVNYTNLIKQLESKIKELIEKGNLNGQYQCKHAKTKIAAEELILKLTNHGNQFFGQDINTESIDAFKKAVKTVVDEVEIEFKKYEGWWNNLNPIFKKILGIIAAIIIFPALAVHCLTEHGYAGTFFRHPKTEVSNTTDEFYKHFSDFIEGEIAGQVESIKFSLS